jgi:hypothetical protein
MVVINYPGATRGSFLEMHHASRRSRHEINKHIDPFQRRVDGLDGPKHLFTFPVIPRNSLHQSPYISWVCLF